MLPTLDAPELVFGLCSPIGTPNQKLVNLLRTCLLKYKYQSEAFKVTSLMKAIKIGSMPLHDKPSEDRYDSYIKYANKIRQLTGMNGALAILCAAKIRNFRRSKKNNSDTYLANQAYIFDQFKRDEEIDVLRQTYGRLFILISLHSEKEMRVRNLTQRIAADHAFTRASADHENTAKILIKRDEDEEGEAHGQKLRDVFPLADLFINIDDLDAAEKTLYRFLDAFFGSNRISPTRDEYGMYIAKSVALRSLDLSRQVGAAICSAHGEVLTLGCNEVPKATGGTYWASDLGDARDYTIERDENERIKRALLADVVRRLSDGKLMKTEKTEDELVNFVLEESARKGSVLREAQLMDLLEFGRIIHAEMSAISDAARLGISVRGSSLYCTTFPCHICAKHIIAAGIRKVVYIEPYPKSYAEQLHGDSILVKTGRNEDQKVQFSPFIGVSPFRFRELFERGKRKDSSGTFAEWISGEPRPIVKLTVANYISSETAITVLLGKKLDQLEKDGEIELTASSD